MVAGGATLALLAGLLSGAADVPPAAAAEHAAASAAACLIPHPGVRIPIVLVHGFHSTAHTWDADLTSLNDTGTGPSVFEVAAEFAYGDNSSNSSADEALSTHWVTDPGIGHDLAAQITCIAKASRAEGGPGKVVLIGHSMGGLAIRCALDASCNDGGRGSLGNLAGKVFEVITFGTPAEGSFLVGGTSQSRTENIIGDVIATSCAPATLAPRRANPLGSLCDLFRAFTTSQAAHAFRVGSAQLAALPDVDPGVPVFALAGRVSVTTSIGTLWHHTVAGDAGDLVVGTASALTGGRRLGKFGGTRVEDCGSLDLSLTAGLIPGVNAYLVPKDLVASLRCTHLTETHDSGFLAEVFGQLSRLPHGRWTEPTITITGSTLGAVTRGMTVTQAQHAAGVVFDDMGDGQYASSQAPDLEASGGPAYLNGGFACLDADTYNVGGPKVVTPAGFTLGGSVTQLKSLYGARLQYTPGTVTTGGYWGPGTVLGAGWYVRDNGGYLLFQTKSGGRTGTVSAIRSLPGKSVADVCSPG